MFILAQTTGLLYPLGAAGFVALSLFWMRLNHMIFGGGAQAASNESRQIQLQTGIPKVLHWPFGYGPGMAATTLGFADNEEGKLTIDNYWLSIGLEYGILGFLLFMTLMGTGITKGIRYGLSARDPRQRAREAAGHQHGGGVGECEKVVHHVSAPKKMAHVTPLRVACYLFTFGFCFGNWSYMSS